MAAAFITRYDGNGPPLALHYGFCGDRELERHFGYVDALREDWQCILLDARGHGASDKLRDPRACELPQRGGDEVAVLDALHITKTHSLGYSKGGWIGWGTERRTDDPGADATGQGRPLSAEASADMSQSPYLVVRNGKAFWIEAFWIETGPMVRPPRHCKPSRKVAFTMLGATTRPAADGQSWVPC
jgi:pimeloyl-ACP methyl ester carboxylesterase